MASGKNDYHFECYEKYVGTSEEIKKAIDECPVCGSKLLISHLPDYKNLLVQETARCMECGSGGRKIIHIIN